MTVFIKFKRLQKPFEYESDGLTLVHKLFICVTYFEIMKELWSSVIGSHLWKMARADSDMDIFVCKLAPSKDILLGKQFKSVETHVESDNIDMTEHELGKVINMLIKGNVNFIWGLTSPNVTGTSPAHEELLAIYKLQISKNCYHSINGLFEHNYKDYIEKIKKPKPKRIWMMYRTLQFGMRILESGVIDYKPVATDISVKQLNEAHENFHQAYLASDLPENPDTEPYIELMYRLRILDLCDAI